MNARELARRARACAPDASARGGKLAINLVGCTPVLTERIRASLRRSLFLFTATEEPLPDAALYAAPARQAQEICQQATPVIAWGPAALLRSSLLAGCADYLKDPWTPEELELRALAVLSRAQRQYLFPWGTVSFEGLDLCTPAGPIPLTLHESRMLKVLLRSRGEPVPRDALSYAAGGTPGPAGSRAVDVHVASLRRKMRAAIPAAGRFILCVRRQGYIVP
ncbi:MAG: winged helix-turn-helix domain-containing protein [Spirochaetia bacterium]|jgi:CheY-like chemotaxis protein